MNKRIALKVMKNAPQYSYKLLHAAYDRIGWNTPMEPIYDLKAPK